VAGTSELLVGAAAMTRPAGNRLLAAFPADSFDLLAPEMKAVMLPHGAVCHEAGDPIELVFFPTSGMVSLLVATGDGALVETGAVGCESAVGLHAGLGPRQSFTRAMVQIPGQFLVLAARRLEQAASQSPALRELILSYMELAWAEAQQNAACNAIHDGSSRLCRWLLQCSDRTGSDQIPLTQEFLAEMLGVRRTTVTLLAQELQKNGLVRYSRGRIAILDRAGLRQCACECYDAVKQENLARLIGVKI